MKTQDDKGISEVIHDTISDLHKIGLVNETTMSEFDAHCLPEVKKYTARQIKAIREANKISQASICSLFKYKPRYG